MGEKEGAATLVCTPRISHRRFQKLFVASALPVVVLVRLHTPHPATFRRPHALRLEPFSIEDRTGYAVSKTTNFVMRFKDVCLLFAQQLGNISG